MEVKFSSLVEKILEETKYLEAAGYKEAESFFAFSLSQVIAELFFDEAGKFQKVDLEELFSSLSLQRIYQAEYIKFVTQKIGQIEREKALQTYFLRLTLPLASPWIEEMVRSSLSPPPVKLTNRKARVALMAAILCPLRQNIGSCFATAPCLFVQYSQTGLLIKDLFDLLTLGFLRKSGEEGDLKIPASVILGKGDLLITVENKEQLKFHMGWIKALESLSLIDSKASLGEKISEMEKRISRLDVHGKKLGEVFTEMVSFGKKEPHPRDVAASERTLSHFSQNILMKMWEYTVASFVDGFSRYTKGQLIISLGLEQSEPLGIGKVIYDSLQQALDEKNKKLEENTREINELRIQISNSEKLLQHVDSDDKYRRLKSQLEYYYQKEAFLLHDRELEGEVSTKITELYSLLCEQITFHLPLYYIEIYDPSLIEKNPTPFEDGAAGFRLVYKHGRADPSVWTEIQTTQDFKNTLQEFFISLEQIVRSQLEKVSIEFLDRVMQKIHALLSEEEFYIACKNRIDLYEQKYPSGKKMITIWSYLSGGTIHTLLEGYFGLPKKPSELIFTPENPRELCLELIEWMKEESYKVCEEVKQDPLQGFLFYSPEHVFLFQPGNPSFVPTWDNREFTYTYVRDRFTDSSQGFYQSIRLTSGEQSYLYDKAMKQGWAPFAPEKLFIEGASLIEFTREHLEGLDFLAQTLFYNHLPLVSKKDLEKVFPSQERINGPFIDLKEWLSTQFLLGLMDEKETLDKVRKAGLLPAPPFIFADTNWHQTKFAFLTGPLSGQIELWRLSTNGLLGSPMSQWDKYFGMKKTPSSWGLFTKKEDLTVDLREIKTRR